jgi:hypothetical protein
MFLLMNKKMSNTYSIINVMMKNKTIIGDEIDKVLMILMRGSTKFLKH